MVNELQLPPEAQQLLLQLQTFQQQMQSVALQRETLFLQKTEIEKALEELEKADDKEEVYKAVGPVLIKSSKNEMKKELAEKKETIELRLKAMEKQEEKIRDKTKENQQKLQEIFKRLAPQGGEAAG